MGQPNDLITALQAAEILGITKGGVQYRTKRGDLVPYYVDSGGHGGPGGHYLFYSEAQVRTSVANRKPCEPIDRPVEVEIPPTEIDCAMMARTIDCEGTIVIVNRKQGKRSYPIIRVSVYNCDRGLIDWIAERFGKTTVQVRRARQQRPNYMWSVSALQAAAVIRQCLPWFLVKRNQADLALEFQDRLSRRDFTRWSGGLTSEEEDWRMDAVLRMSRLNRKPEDLL